MTETKTLKALTLRFRECKGGRDGIVCIAGECAIVMAPKERLDGRKDSLCALRCAFV